MKTSKTSPRKPHQAGLFAGPIQQLFDKEGELKLYTEDIKKLEKNYPQSTKEKMVMLKALRAEVKAEQEQYVLGLARDHSEYHEQREKVQILKSEIGEIKDEIRMEGAKRMDRDGELDETVLVQGEPFRIQGSKTYGVFINGKAI